VAGIGFTLRRLFRQDTFIDRTRAYAFSALVAAGPWISAVLVVNIQMLVAERLIVSPAGRFLFMATIVYAFVFSQIITAPWQFVITRYIADKLFVKEYDYLQASFSGLSKLLLVLSLVIAVAFFFTSPLPLHYKYMAGSLFLVLTQMWLIMVYLSAAKDYYAIARAFVVGGAISVAATVLLLAYPIGFASHLQASNMLLAYLLGVVVTYLLLLRTLFGTFPFGNGLEFDFVRYLGKVTELFWIGLLYTLGIWVDTILLWHSPHGGIIHNTFRFSLLYDHAKFLAYLTIIPTTVLFLVYVETEFYGKFKRYFQAVREKRTLAEITAEKDGLVQLVSRHVVYLLERQLILSLTIIVLSDQLFLALGLSPALKDMFRITTLAALCNAMLLVVLLILLYFEARREAMLAAATFFTVNFAATLWLIPRGPTFFGVPLFIAALAAFLLGLRLLSNYFRKLTYLTFAQQPFFVTPDRSMTARLADHLNAWQTRRNCKGHCGSSAGDARP